jgi:hypothetical protein
MAVHDSYPEPLLGTRAEAIKAALKAHRTLHQVRLTSRDETATGRALPDRTAFLLDVWRLVEQLPAQQRCAVKLYFMIDRGPHPRGVPANECRSCDNHYDNTEVGRDMNLSGPNVSRQVAALKRHAVARLEARLFPDEVRERKARYRV